MFCKNCNKRIKEDDNFCPNCGAKLEKVESLTVEEVSSSEQLVVPQEFEDILNSYKRWIKIIAILVMIVMMTFRFLSNGNYI